MSIKTIKVKDFEAVPYLESSLLMQSHRKGITLSLEKPNVIVGPNGAGKSALLTALALHSFSYFAGISSLDENFTSRSRHGQEFWSKKERWGDPLDYLAGFACDSDNAPAIYYRPGHIPGNDDSVCAAMMCGYGTEAREYAIMVEKKSSGQGNQARLDQVLAALKGDLSGIRYKCINWHYGTEARTLDYSGWIGDWERQTELMKKLVREVSPDAIPMLLLDEPEQSLDALAETKLWKMVAKADHSRLQVIAATHSLYPLLHQEDFNLIEAVPGYIKEVRAVLDDVEGGR